MSSIPKGRRAYSKLEIFQKACNIRDMVIGRLMLNFGLDNDKMKAYVAKILKANGITEESDNSDRANRIRDISIDGIEWMIRRQRDVIAELLEGLCLNIIAGNGVNPRYYEEYIDRRRYWNKCLGICSELQVQLTFIVDKLPVNKNFYLAIVEDLDALYSKIYNLRKSDADRYGSSLSKNSVLDEKDVSDK